MTSSPTAWSTAQIATMVSECTAKAIIAAPAYRRRARATPLCSRAATALAVHDDPIGGLVEGQRSADCFTAWLDQTHRYAGPPTHLVAPVLGVIDEALAGQRARVDRRREVAAGLESFRAM